MKKKLVAALLTAAMAMSLLAGCGSSDSKGSDADSKETAESTEDSDQEAADKVADLIDAIYVQERTEDTDKQCEEAKTAWDKLTEFQRNGTALEDVHCVITDIEMPQMDGHRLTKLVKSDKEFQHIPLVIFSSLITEEMRRKGKELGADEQMSKPEIGHLVQVIDHLLEHTKS